MNEPIDVDILTGFLGSGKTSLIRRLVDGGALTETAILVNEMADLPVDRELINLSGAAASVVGDRCLCCVTDGNLRAAIVALIESKANGTVPPFRRILIETSGIADPTSLIATLSTDPILKARVRLGRVVTLVDLCHGSVTLDESAEAMSQLIAADIILLTKADLAEAGTAEQLADRIGAVNPIARTFAAGGLDPFDRSLLADQALPARAIRSFMAAPTTPGHNRIVASVLTAEAPVAWARLAAWLSLLLHRHGDAILRIKGSVGIEMDDGPVAVVVQSVRHVVHKPEHMPANGGAPQTALAVIARGLDHERLAASFRRHVTEEKVSKNAH
ncbi:GTPase, G3E family [Kaistia soli DSM 19436]|uniref:GTPase, G3E family n=1 Tax=Kaistia soli DSM 19436 TaxID=1122133 RepID=A0A1M5G0U2_9HYPH|nr:GTP-binding protein [Kaistia soli]SHF97081.1 GTPase, G3E family [Kaistia soli DSM 19436]